MGSGTVSVELVYSVKLTIPRSKTIQSSPCIQLNLHCTLETPSNGITQSRCSVIYHSQSWRPSSAMSVTHDRLGLFVIHQHCQSSVLLAQSGIENSVWFSVKGKSALAQPICVPTKDRSISHRPSPSHENDLRMYADCQPRHLASDGLHGLYLSRKRTPFPFQLGCH